MLIQASTVRITDATPPTAPTITPTAVSDTGIDVALTAQAVDIGSGVAGYRLEYKRTVDSSWTLDGAALSVAQFPRQITGLTPSTSYDFRCRATDYASNVGAFSATSSTSTQASGSLPLGTLALDGPATPEQIALVLPITGSLSQSFTAAVRVRLATIGVYQTVHPLLRVQPSYSNTPSAAFGGAIEDVFAGTIIDLSAGTSYDVEVTVTDGVTTVVKTLTTTTRALPAARGAVTVHIAGGSTSSQIATAWNAAPANAVVQIDGNCTFSSAAVLTTGGGGGQTKTLCCAPGVVLDRTTVGTFFVLSGAITDCNFEDITLQGNGVDQDGTVAVTYTTGWGVDTQALKQRLTFRRITATGIDRFIRLQNSEQSLYYDCSATGNNLWSNSPVDYLDTSRTWNDDGIMLAGRGNAAFNCTLIGFGDPIAYASHNSGGEQDVISAHVARCLIRNALDDCAEFDFCRRNITFIDNYCANIGGGCDSMDPLYGGPALIARNVFINPAWVNLHKWNSSGSGWLHYNNTYIATTKAVRNDQTAAFWYTANGGRTHKGYAHRNNIYIGPAGVGRTLWLDTFSSDPLDWTHNSWSRDLGHTLTNSEVFGSLAAAQSGVGNRTPVFGSFFSPNSRPFAQDNICEQNPFVNAVTLGATALTEYIGNAAPTIAAATQCRGNGIAIPGVTDGFSGPAPDRGALIAGRMQPAWGDRRVGPDYISSMAQYEVRAMSGPYAPASGLITMADITPQGPPGDNWVTGDPGTVKLAAVAHAWTTGAKGKGKKLFIPAQGGHKDTANNGAYTFDYDGNTAPNGWVTPLDISPLSAVFDRSINGGAGADQYTDGKWPSAHGYDGAVYVGATNCAYRFIGSSYSDNGAAWPTAWRYNLTTKVLTRLTDVPIPITGASYCTAYDEASGKIALIMPNKPSFAILRLSDHTWQVPTGTMVNGATEQTAAYDSLRQRIVLFGSSHIIYTMNWSTPSFVESTYTPTGATGTLNNTGVSAVYDAQRDVFWYWGGALISNISAIYEMNASTFAVTQHTFLSGATIPVDVGGSGFQGTFGRFIFMDEWRAIGMVHSTSTAAYVLKLPA